MAEVDFSYSTIVSLLPYNITEPRPGMTPSEFIVWGKDSNEIGLTLITNKAHYLINPDPLSDPRDVKQIPVMVPAQELANSIINDYVSSLLGVDPPLAVPGLFAIRGNYTDTKIVKALHSANIITYTAYQLNWFTILVNIADDTWAKTRSPLGISDLERAACKELGYQRDWINPPPSELQNKCPMCKTAINLGAIKCIACGFILNKAEYDKLMAEAK